jgi:hypothetical protein
MRISADPAAVAFISEHGGMVFVRPYRAVLCGPITDLEATTEPPRGALDYQRVETERFLLFLHPSIRRRPEELVVAVRGRHRPRVRVYWDGCTVGY